MVTIMSTNLLGSMSSSVSLHEQEDDTSTHDLATSTNETSVIASFSTIRFDLENIAVHPVERIDEVSQAERDMKWYGKADYDIIKARNNLTVKVMKVGRQNPELFGHCYRGLEHRQAVMQRRKDSTRNPLFRSIFEEQKRQILQNKRNPELLAAVSDGYSKMSVNTALKLAKDDAEAAAEFLQEPHTLVEVKNDEYLPIDVIDDDDDIPVLDVGWYGGCLTGFGREQLSQVCETDQRDGS
jgi:hypothetical protein